MNTNLRTVHNAMLAATLATGVVIGCATGPANAQSSSAIPPSLVTPDKVETSIGTLEFKDGAPTVETAEKVHFGRDVLLARGSY